ncbi:MAG: hypothetical protein KF688_12490 [Pirellulales bacterium]|nr:hypothetical protein [Pirellulales bacterium]
MSSASHVSREDFQHWQRCAQTGELHFHVHDAPRPDAAIRRRDAELLAGFGFAPHDFAGELVVDVGAGPYLRTKYFEQSRIAVVEPLADEYRRQVPWNDLADAEAVYSVPAETIVPELTGQAACVLSLNAIDHAFEPGRILTNMRRYLKPDGVLLVSVDMHAGDDDDLHPVALTPELLAELVIDAGCAIERGYLYTPQGRNYGHGYACTLVARPRTAGQPDGRHTPLVPLRTPVQLAWEETSRRAGSLARRARRVATGQSRTMRRLLSRAG